VFTLDDCAHIVGTDVISFKKEDAMLLAWREFVEKVDPDVVIGYNIAGFDLPYLLDRARALKGANEFPFLGRLKSSLLNFALRLVLILWIRRYQDRHQGNSF
jgi:DNA polymerase delta subunit 1